MAHFTPRLLISRKAGLSTQTYDELVGSSRMDCDFYQTFMGWARKGDATTHPFALSVADHTITDAAELARSLGLEAGVLEATRLHYASAVADGFGEANLPELVRAVAHANGFNLFERPGKGQLAALGLHVGCPSA